MFSSLLFQVHQHFTEVVTHGSKASEDTSHLPQQIVFEGIPKEDLSQKSTSGKQGVHFDVLVSS